MVLAWSVNRTRFRFISISSCLGRATQEPLINKRAAEDLHRALIATTPDKMLEQLRLLTIDRRPEVAALATRTLCLLGDFESLFGDSGRLNSLSLRSYWNSMVDDLRSSVAQSKSDGRAFKRASMPCSLIGVSSICDLWLGTRSRNWRKVRTSNCSKRCRVTISRHACWRPIS